MSWGKEGAVTSSREDAILRLGNGSQGARQRLGVGVGSDDPQDLFVVGRLAQSSCQR